MPPTSGPPRAKPWTNLHRQGSPTCFCKVDHSLLDCSPPFLPFFDLPLLFLFFHFTKVTFSQHFITVAPGSKTVGKGLRDGVDGLDEQETQQYRSLVGTALYVGQDRPETQYATKEAARFMSGSTRAAKCALKRLCKYYSEAPILGWSFPYHEMPSEIRAVTDANWAGEPEDCAQRRVDGFALVIICWRRIH